MKKSEAIMAMQNGKKVTWRYFSKDEWTTMVDGYIVLEDGVRCKPELFWSYRTNPDWDDGYSLFV